MIQKKLENQKLLWVNMFVCKSISLANFLIANKSNLIKIDRDKENKNYLVFLFKKNETLENTLSKWRSNKQVDCCESEVAIW